MSPVINIRKRDRQPGWLQMDFRDDEDIEAVIVIPTFGPNHNVGIDCWCHPTRLEELIVHNEHH